MLGAAFVDVETQRWVKDSFMLQNSNDRQEPAEVRSLIHPIELQPPSMIYTLSLTTSFLSVSLSMSLSPSPPEARKKKFAILPSPVLNAAPISLPPELSATYMYILA